MKPIQIKEYTPLTEPEMKSIFGGSGENDDSGKYACSTEGSYCNIKYEFSSEDNTLAPPSTLIVSGICTTESGSYQLSSGSTIKYAVCDCRSQKPM